MTEEIKIEKTIELREDKPIIDKDGLLIDAGHSKGEPILCQTTGKPIILEYLSCGDFYEP